MRDLRELPKVRDGLSYLYLEHGRVEQKYKAVEFVDKEGGCTLVPAAALGVLMLGPGTTITHAAVKSLARPGIEIASDLWEIFYVSDRERHEYIGTLAENRLDGCNRLGKCDQAEDHEHVAKSLYQPLKRYHGEI